MSEEENSECAICYRIELSKKLLKDIIFYINLSSKDSKKNHRDYGLNANAIDKLIKQITRLGIHHAIYHNSNV